MIKDQSKAQIDFFKKKTIERKVVWKNFESESMKIQMTANQSMYAVFWT